MASSSRSTKFKDNQKVEVQSGWGYNDWTPATYIRTNAPALGLKQYLVSYDHDPREYHFVPTNRVRAVPMTANNVEFNVGDAVEVFRNNMWMEAVVTGKNGEKFDLNVKQGDVNLAGIHKGSIRPKTAWTMGEEEYREPKQSYVTPGLDNNLELN